MKGIDCHESCELAVYCGYATPLKMNSTSIRHAPSNHSGT
jgi:hypothetical protein